MRSGGAPADGALDAELTALRERAYGVDADIDGDPRAMARLAELEQLHAAASTAAWAEEPPPEPAAEPGIPDAVDEPRPPVDGPDADTGDALTHRWWPRTRRGAFVAGFCLAAAVVGAIMLWMLPAGPPPDATLRPTGSAPSEQVLRLADFARRQMVVRSTLQGFEPVLGLEVWSAQTSFGNECLLVIDPGADDLLEVACAPPAARPEAEIYDVPVAWNQQWTDAFPSGTMIRFVLVGDAVDVWIFEGER